MEAQILVILWIACAEFWRNAGSGNEVDKAALHVAFDKPLFA